MKHSKHAFAGVLSTLVLLLASASPGNAQLSFFGTTNQEINLSGMSVGSVVTDSQSVILGGVSTTRTLTGTVTNTLNPISLQAYIYDGVLGASQGGGDGSREVVEWGASQAMGLNLADYGDAFVFTHWSNDGVTGSQVEITVWNGTTSFTSPVTTLTHGSFGGSPTYDYSIPFSAFVGADFTHVDRLAFTLNAVTAADLEIANFQVIPEPSAAALAFLTVGTLLLRRRRN